MEFRIASFYELSRVCAKFGNMT